MMDAFYYEEAPEDDVIQVLELQDLYMNRGPFEAANNNVEEEPKKRGLLGKIWKGVKNTIKTPAFLTGVVAGFVYNKIFN